jgi:RHS repeat-associated protein
MSALARTTEINCDTRAANEDCINGGSRTRTKYTYDANGNMWTRNGLTNTWASYNLPTLLQPLTGGLTSQLSYGPEHQRYKQIAPELNGTETTYYVGGLLEKMTASSSRITYWRHYVETPSGKTIIVSRNSDLSTTTNLVLSDHLGSSDAIVNGLTGALNVQESFSPFGLRRQSDWQPGLPAWWDQIAITESTRHGFTGQEHLDNVELVHLNGRVYDPIIGRFLSVDPFAGDGTDSQRLNPYSYVDNRPLIHTDPSGFDFDDPISFGSGAGSTSTAINKQACDTMFCTLYGPGPTTSERRTSDPSAQQTTAHSAQQTAGPPGAQGVDNTTIPLADRVPSPSDQPMVTSAPTADPPLKQIVVTGAKDIWEFVWDKALPAFAGESGTESLIGAAVGGVIKVGGRVTQAAKAAPGAADALDEVVVTAKAVEDGTAIGRGAIEMHHLLPQAGRFAKFFERAGLNIEEYKIPLDQAAHRLKPGGIHTKAGGDWNGVWDKFFEVNPNATKDQILNQLRQMRADFGI